MLLKIAKILANPKTRGKIILRPVLDVFPLPEAIPADLHQTGLVHG